MSSDLSKIKEKYGEKMMHLCRKSFSTILEDEGKLFELISSHFAYSKYLYDDIVNNMLEDNFKNYIYGLYNDNMESDVIVDDRSPYELMNCAGYTLYECKSEEDIQSFKKYFDSRELLCTFRGNRLRKCYVFFAIRNNVDEIKRDDFINPYRQDLYGTSVISIQFSRGDINTLSIKNRYNHTVNNPDATYSNNLDNIIPGLTYSFEKYYDFNISNKGNFDFEIPGYVKTRDTLIDGEIIPGKYYKYNYEINNIYYCDNNVIIDNFTIIDDFKEKEKFIIMDYFIVDLVNKKIRLYDNMIEDSFIDTIGNIKKIDIVKNKVSKSRVLNIILDSGNIVIIEIDQFNRIIGYENNNIDYILDDFLKHNIYLKSIMINNVLRIGNNFLYNNLNLKNISSIKILDIGNSFLYKNNSIEYICLPNVVRIGNDFLYKNRVISNINMDSLTQVGDSFLYDNKLLKEFSLLSLLYVGNNFITCNKEIEKVYLNSLVNVGDNFLSGNKKLIKMKLSNLRRVGDNFLRCNEMLTELYVDNLEIVGSNFMYSNRCLETINLSRVRVVGNNFLYKNNSIKILELNELYKAGPCFMKENNSLMILYASKLMIVGLNFLPNNSVLQYLDLSSLKEYNRGFLDNNHNVRKRVLKLC